MHLKTSSSVNRRPARARPVTVHFPVPKRAISKLRSLAIEKDPRLVDLGVLAVQISDDENENIVLGIDLEKPKGKGLVISNKTSTSTFSNPSRGALGFQALSRNFQTPTSGFYPNQFMTTAAPRNEPLASKIKKSAQNTVTKKRAKETLNAARRGGAKARSRAGRVSIQLPPASAKTSTWEMVYSHIGVPGEQLRKQSNPPHFEPSVASKACGIANVPVAQPILPKENVTKGDSKRRETAAKSPPHKSPSAASSAFYSEDDSSVSSSPCSHSPMNEEELLNLFVDQNFSATSILKQLAESCNKGEKNSDAENSEQKGSDQNTSIKWNQEAPGLSMTPIVQPEKSKTDASFNGVESHPFVSSHISTGESLNQLNNTSTSTNSASSHPNSAVLKRPNLLDDSSSCSASWSNLFENPAKRQKRIFPAVDTKKETVDPSIKAFELHKELQPTAVEKQTQDTKLQTTVNTSNNQPSSKTPSQNEALRNYSQYGYYYTAEELKALGKKALPLKSTSKGSFSKANKNESVQQNINTTTSWNGAVLSSSTNLHLQTKPQELLTQDNTSTISLSNQGESQQQQRTKDFCSLTAAVKGTAEESLINGSAALSENVCVSSSSKVIIQETAPLISVSAGNSTSETISSLSSVSSTNATTTKPESVQTDANSINLRKTGGQCYALSYVYPMGTVWYPYVAITPYAVLGNGQKTDSECDGNEKEKANSIEGLSQYIDLASSMRYWQQLSLLYKNKLLASTPSVANLFVGQDRSVSVNSSASSLSAASASESTLQKNASIASSSSVANKPPRRASVIVTTPEYSKEERPPSSSTPESTASTESIASDGSKSDVPVVIDNCNRLIEEHCNRMSEVLSNTTQDVGCNSSSESTSVPAVPSLSFIPDSSIAYVNIGNNSAQGARRSAGNGKESKGKAKKRKSSKNV